MNHFPLLVRLDGQGGVDEHAEEHDVDAEMGDGTAEGLAHLALDVDAVAHADNGAVAGPGVPKGKGEGDLSRGVVDDGADGEDEADEAGEEEATAVGLEDEGSGVGQRLELAGGTEDEGQGGRGGDEVVEEEGGSGGREEGRGHVGESAVG